VLELVSRQTKTNLVLLSPPSAKLTINLTNVRLIDMIRHICALTQLSHVKVGSTFVLAGEIQLKAAYPAEWNAANPQTAPAAPTRHLDQGVQGKLREQHTDRGRPREAIRQDQAQRRSGACTGQSERYGRTTLSATTGVQPVTTATNSTGTSRPAGDQAVVETGAKVLILRGDPATVEEAYKLAQQMDTARPQVAIEVTIYDISNTALKELGLSWTVGNVNLTEKSTGDVGFGSFTRAPQTFSAVVKALEEKDRAKLLASPNISVLDGEKAYILIGDRINFPVLVGYSQAGSPSSTERWSASGFTFK